MTLYGFFFCPSNVSACSFVCVSACVSCVSVCASLSLSLSLSLSISLLSRPTPPLSLFSRLSLSLSSPRWPGWLRRPPQERADPRFYFRLRRDFSVLSHTSGLKNWHSSDYPAKSLVSVNSSWVETGKFDSAASISLWQHIQLSEQIHP